MPLIRIGDGVYKRLQALATPFVDTPASIIEKLLDHYEETSEMTMTIRNPEIPQAPRESDGYLLLAQQDWLAFHERHSVGTYAMYCRGIGAPMRNVPVGGTVACARTGEVPNRIHLLGQFGGWDVLTIQDAWNRHRERLGAGSLDEWRALVQRIDSIANSGQVGLIRIDQVTVPQQPIELAPIGIELRRGALKGRRLTAEEVVAIQRARNL